MFLFILIGVDPYNYPEKQTVEQETSHSPLNSPYRQIPSAGSIPVAPYISHQVSHPSYHPRTHLQPEVMHSSLNTIAQVNNYTPSLAPALHQTHPHFWQTQGHAQYPGQSHSSGYYANNEFSQPAPMHNTSHSAASKNVSVSTKTPKRDLPSYKIPVDSPILWQLSREVREWKFLGRFLDLDEDVIEEIDQYTRPNKTRDKSLKVLKEWVNSSPEPTWKALGEIFLEAENALLYEKLLELIKSYEV